MASIPTNRNYLQRINGTKGNIMSTKFNRLITAAAGLGIGIVNGLLGAGGGMIAVPILKKLGLEQKEAHVSILSAVLYLVKDYVNLNNSFAYIPTGVLGAVAGTYILRKISPVWLKRIFGGYMVYAGARLLLK